MKTYDSAYSGSMFERADGDYVRRDDPVSLADALLETIHKSRDSLNDALDWKVQLENELEAAKQRELELLAVIENIQTAFKFAAEMAIKGDDSDIRSAHIKMLDALYAEPSQALREHEAKVLEEAAAYFNSDDVDNWEIAGVLNDMAEERRKK